MLQRISIRAWRRFGRSDDGQDLLEYALLVALIVLVVITAVSPLGQTIKTVFWDAISTTTSAI
jgi:Flp pilus assembly pilin Flp